jgi:hypothetical protein
MNMRISATAFLVFAALLFCLVFVCEDADASRYSQQRAKDYTAQIVYKRYPNSAQMSTLRVRCREIKTGWICRWTVRTPEHCSPAHRFRGGTWVPDRGPFKVKMIYKRCVNII